MSASREKRRRKEQGTEKIVALENEKAVQAKKDKTFMIIAAAAGIALVVLFIVLLFLNSGILQRSVKAVTVGDHDVKVADFNYYYNSNMKSAISNMGDYAAYYGLDVSKDLHDQPCYFDEEISWADYFCDTALDNLQSDLVLSDLAEAEGLELSEDAQALYDQTIAATKQYAATNGMSFDQYIKAMFGKGFTESRFNELVRRSCLATQYQADIVDGFEYTPDDLEAFYEEDPTVFNGYTYRSYFINGYDSDEEVKAQKLQESHDKADEMAARINEVEGVEAKEELFNELTIEYAAEEYRESYELDPDFTISRFKNADTLDEYLSEFILGEDRQPGDVEVIDGTTGYYVVMYLDYARNEYQQVTFRQIKISPNTETNGHWSDEEWAAAEETANTIYELTLADDFTVDKFAEYVTTYSDDANTAQNGGQIASAVPGAANTFVTKWLYDGEHEEGETAVIKGTDGYYVVYFESYDGVAWENNATTSLKTRDYENWFSEASADYEISKNAAGIRLSDY